MNRYDAGRRNVKIIIQTPTSTPDGMGGRSKTWSDLCAVWGEVRRPRVHTAVVQGGVAMVTSQEVIIPTTGGINAGCRAVINGQNYEIVGVAVTADRYMSLILKEVEHYAG